MDINTLLREIMRKVDEKKYLGDIISNNMKNETNIKDKKIRCRNCKQVRNLCVYSRPGDRSDRLDAVPYICIVAGCRQPASVQPAVVERTDRLYVAKGPPSSSSSSLPYSANVKLTARHRRWP